MAVSMYAIAVPTFQKHLSALDAILDKAEAYATAKKIDPSRASPARLYPECSTSRVKCSGRPTSPRPRRARLAGLPVPSFPTPRRRFPNSSSASRRRWQFSPASSRSRWRAGRRAIHDQGRPERNDVYGQRLPAAFCRSRTSISIARPPTTSCATTASRSASAISCAGRRAIRAGRSRSAADLQLDGTGGHHVFRRL